MACYDADHDERRSVGKATADGCCTLSRSKSVVISGEKAEQKLFAVGGQRNPLKRPNSAKRIQGFPCSFPWKNLVWLGVALVDLGRIWPPSSPDGGAIK